MSDRPSLAGSLARIDRADELTRHLTAACKAFCATRPYTIEERPDPNPKTRAFVVTALADLPPLPRIIAGEIAHHLRASLDLMVYQLMLKEGVTDEKTLKASAFPVLDHNLTTTQGAGDFRAAIKKTVGALPPAVQQRIEDVQPANTNHEWSHLAQVQRLDNTQKHRLLLAAAAGTRLSGWNFRNADGTVTTMPHHSFTAVQVDTLIKVEDVTLGFVLPNLAQEVCFIEPGPQMLQPMDHNLSNLSRMIRETVLSFADCF